MFTNEPDRTDDGYAKHTHESEDDFDFFLDWSVYDKEEMNSESIEDENEFESIIKIPPVSR
jgi:hypothetical protein